MAQNPRMD